MKKSVLSVLIIVFSSQMVFSQNVIKVIQLDSVTVEATRRGFDVNDFIQWVQQDTTFYKAFKNLHFYPYKMESKLSVYDKSSNEKAVLLRNAEQKVENSQRWIIVTAEKTQGNMYNRKNEYNYYTAELFDHIFYPKGTLPASNILRTKNKTIDTERKNEKYTEKLKTLMFNPGAGVDGVPLVGNKMAIFDEKMTKHYDYKIFTDTLNDSIPCYVFQCTAKKTSDTETDGKAVIKNLSTWFDKRTLNVLSRVYTMSYNSIVFDFDVTMDVKLEQINNALVPVSVKYNGFWDVPFRKRETVAFTIRFSEFKIPEL